MRSSLIIRNLAKLRQAKYTRLSGMGFKRNASTLNGLPFKITRDQANEKLTNHRRFLEESTSGNGSTAMTLYKGDPIKECYIPFHSAEVTGVHSSYAGEYGEDRTEYYWETVYDGKESRQVLQSRTVTDWYRCSGTTSYTDYPFGTLSTQIYAGFEYPRKLIEQVLQIPEVVHIQPITKEMLEFGGSKKIVYPHEMNMSFALEKLSSRLYDMEKSRAHEQIIRKHRADHSRVHSLDVHLGEAQINLFSYHVPAYIYQSKVMDLASYKIINGFSGDIYGNKIYSILKSSLFGAGMGGILTWAFTAFTRPYMLLPQILFRVALGTSVSGTLSGTMANFFNTRQDRNFISGKKLEMDENSHHIESDEDKERRQLADEINKEFDYVNKKNNIRLPVDKCKLLGLNPDDDITLDMVKTAYRNQVKKWHPDLFREQGSKKLAEAMAQQINEANSELTEILRKHQPK